MATLQCRKGCLPLARTGRRLQASLHMACRRWRVPATRLWASPDRQASPVALVEAMPEPLLPLQQPHIVRRSLRTVAMGATLATAVPGMAAVASTQACTQCTAMAMPCSQEQTISPRHRCHHCRHCWLPLRRTLAPEQLELELEVAAVVALPLTAP